MAYYKPGIWDTIVDRLVGDATLIGASLLNGSKIYVNQAPPGTALPYITLTLINGQPDDMFTTRGRICLIDINVWVQERTTTVDAGAIRAGILERIDGDWQEQSSGDPSYGLDHWKPGQIAATGWYINEFIHVQDRDESEPGLYHDVYTVQCGVYKEKA
jgi:hypothetical protein